MQSPTRFHTNRIAAAVVAIAALGASASSFAGGGETVDSGIPSVRPAVTVVNPSLTAEEAALARNDAQARASFGVALTREDVREQLRQARANGTMSLNGEGGDTETVLAARDAFNAAQGEALMTAYLAEQQRTVALAEAELRRSEIEAAAQLEPSLALSEGEVLMPEGAAAIERDSAEVRIDVIDMQTSAAPTSAPDEMVIVSLDGGDLARQHEQAMHVRRQLGAMGLPQERIYVESTDAPATADAVAAADGDLDVAAFSNGQSDAVMAADDRSAELTAVAGGEGN